MVKKSDKILLTRIYALFILEGHESEAMRRQLLFKSMHASTFLPSVPFY